MPLFFLKIKAELENVRSLVPLSGNLWKFDIQSPGAADVREGITVTVEDTYPLEGSRGEANFMIKWPYTNEQAYIKILSAHRDVKTMYRAEDSGNYVTILALECRGLEPTKWHPSVDFSVVSAHGKVYKAGDEVDLRDRDWAEYDAEHDENVQVFNLDYRIDQTP
eukprot:gene30473-36832_t